MSLGFAARWGCKLQNARGLAGTGRNQREDTPIKMTRSAGRLTLLWCSEIALSSFSVRASHTPHFTKLGFENYNSNVTLHVVQKFINLNHYHSIPLRDSLVTVWSVSFLIFFL